MFKGVGRQLEFDKVLLEVSRLVKSEPGREKVLAIEPSVDFD